MTTPEYICKGCSKPLIAGQLRRGDNWHADCFEAMEAKVETARANLGLRRRRKPRDPNEITRAQRRVAEALSTVLEVDVDPSMVLMYPARGYWTHNHQDVQRWTGSFTTEGRKLSYSIGSWQLTLNDLNRGRKFEVHDYRGDYLGDNNFQFEPLT